MKKFIAFLLCFMFVFPLFSCNGDITPPTDTDTGTTTGTTSGTTDEILSDIAATDYADVLTMYRSVINICPNYVDHKDATEEYAAKLGITDEKENELFSDILTYTYLQYPGRGKEDYSSPHYKLSCGYAIKDLNGDKVDELVLLNNDYTIVAIVTLVDGESVFLRGYYPAVSAWIGGDGLIHIGYTDFDYYYVNRVYQVIPGDTDPTLILEYGYHTRSSDEYYSKYYLPYYKMTNDDDRIGITQEEYNSYDEQYGNYNGNTGKEATEKYSGLKFNPLFSDPDIATEMYDAALEYKINVYDKVADKFILLRDCKVLGETVPLTDKDDLGIAYVDLDGDKVNELIIDCGGTIVLRYSDGKVCFESFSEDAQASDTAYREYFKSYPKDTIDFSPFDAEDLLSLEEVQKIAIKYLGLKDIIDAACGTTLLSRIDIIDESEDFYRVTHWVLSYSHDAYNSGGAPHHSAYDMEFLIDKRTGAKNCIIDSDYERFNENKDKLSPNEIRQIASDYWKIKDGDIDSEAGSILYLFEKYGYDGTFYVDLVLFSDRKEFSVIKSMKVNAHTGEITIPDWCK